MSVPRTKPTRAINIPGNDIGGKRNKLYAGCWAHLKQAMKDGYYLEAITLCESIIADRLEARRAWIHNQDEEKRRFSTPGQLANELLGENLRETEDARANYREVKDWTELRNKALHQMVKLEEDRHETWEEKYSSLKNTAEKGMLLCHRISLLIKKLNKPPA